jgi:CRP-like cAMP-binding protein
MKLMPSSQFHFPPVTASELLKELPENPVLELEKGITILREGTKAGGCYFLLKGRAQVLKRTGKRSGNLSLATITSGGFIGEMSMFTGGKRTASVIALTNVKLLEIKRDQLLRLLTGEKPISAKLALHFVSTTAQRAHSLHQFIVKQAKDRGRRSTARTEADLRHVLDDVYALWAV